MQSWRKANGLIRLAGMNRDRARRDIARLEAQRSELLRQCQALLEQVEALKMVLVTEHRHSKVMSRAGIYEVRRREAVIRARIAALKLERDGLLIDERRLADEQEQCQERYRHWHAKHHKFQRWVDEQRRLERIERDLAEEAETQERTVWNR